MLVLHIGFHKTGTTALQEYFTAHREYLARQGVVYPAGLSTWPSHPELAWAFSEERYAWQDKDYNRENVLRYYKTVLEGARGDQIVLISSEEFCRFDEQPEALDRLAEFVKPFNPVVVAYVRRPLHFLLSRYRHEVVMGGEARRLIDFLKDETERSNFPARLAQWKRLFPGRLRLRHYEQEVIRLGDTISSFANFLEIYLENLPTRNFPELHPHLLALYKWAMRSSLDCDRKDKLISDIAALSSRLPKSDLSELIFESELPNITRERLLFFEAGMASEDYSQPLKGMPPTGDIRPLA